MKPIKLFLSICTMLLCIQATAQSVGIGIINPNPSAMLEVASTNKGMLVPRMFAAQRIALPTPANGLLVYDIDSTCFAYQVGGSWFFLKGTTNIANNWNTTGNAGTSAANFIGTTDAQDLRIRVGNTPSGIITNVGDNIGLGKKALLNNTGSSSIGIGKSALENNTASNNFAIGDSALVSNIDGYRNIALGVSALQKNIMGHQNVAIGVSAMQNNVAGNFVTAVGDSALFNNYIGVYNVAIGSNSLLKNTTGSLNVAVGKDALYKNISGFLNTSTGISSLYNNETGQNNTADGAAALYFNFDGNENTANGASALQDNMHGSRNTANGKDALRGNFTGTNNTANGVGALSANFDGNYNTADGQAALYSNRSGFYNTALGHFADVTSNNLNYATAIGANAKVSCNNCMVLGANTNTTPTAVNIRVGLGTSNPIADLHIKGTNESYPTNSDGGLRLERKFNTNAWNIFTDFGNDLDFNFNGSTKAYLSNATGVYTVASDVRLKKEINPITNILPTVLQLQPKTYFYKDNAADAPLSYGFIAQEVEKLFPAFVTTKGVDGMKAIAYQNFNVVAIQAIKEQQVIIENQNKTIGYQKTEIEKLRADMLLIKQKLGIQ
jgi:trimeric autotransporter adhesin